LRKVRRGEGRMEREEGRYRRARRRGRGEKRGRVRWEGKVDVGG